MKYLCLNLVVILNSLYYQASGQVDSLAFFMQQYQYAKVVDRINNIDSTKLPLELLYLKGIAEKGLNKNLEAISSFEKILSQNSSNLKIIIELGNCCNKIGHYKRAAKYYISGLEIDPDNNYILQQIGNSYYKNENYNEALENYFTALKNDTTQYLTKQIANCYLKLNKIDSAIYFYKKSIISYPKEYESVYKLTNLLIDQKEYTKGIYYTNIYIKEDSTNKKINKLNGYLNYLNEDYENAIKMFKRCISQKDTSYFVNKYLGHSYFKIKEYGIAKDFLEKAFLADTLNADLCYYLGMSCNLSYYKKLAIKYLNKTLTLLKPDDITLSKVYQGVAKANTECYLYEDAKSAFLEAYKLTPKDTLLIFKIANHYDNWIKDPTTALKYYQEFMSTRPKSNNSQKKEPEKGCITISYYDYVERKINEIQTELFWHNSTPDTTYQTE